MLCPTQRKRETAHQAKREITNLSQNTTDLTMKKKQISRQRGGVAQVP